MTDSLEGAHPDDRAECWRCGALVRVAKVGRHDRFHEWLDELAAALDRVGGQLEPEPVPWPTAPSSADVEPDVEPQLLEQTAQGQGSFGGPVL